MRRGGRCTTAAVGCSWVCWRAGGPGAGLASSGRREVSCETGRGATSRDGDGLAESYVVFGSTCVWDCANHDGNVGVVDFLALLAHWGSTSVCDFDGGGVGQTDFPELLANWGPCPSP